MCGFLGEFSFGNSDLTNTKSFNALLELSKHRGPDNTSIIQDKGFQLGFNRLAILDLSTNGNQPKYSPSKRYAIVFNGELYNYKQLQREHHLKNLNSTSDTEVLIHLLDKCGIKKTINLLNGMYAIAIIDKLKRTVSLARDFAGIKPLFYGQSQNGLVFASQFDQIFKHPWHSGSLELRPEIIKEYFGFGFMHPPNTVYRNIYQVEPGQLLQFSETGKLKSKHVTRFTKEIRDNAVKNVQKKSYYNNILKDVISRQLESDVPLALFLSGGVDSPLINAIAKNIKKDIAAFTFGIDHTKFDESEKAIRYAQHLRINHTVEQIDENELVSHVEDHFKGLSEPLGDYSSIPTYLITKKARNSHTVMLSGDGGDELFFGYPRMLDILNKRHWFRIPYLLRRPLFKVLNKFNFVNTWAPYSFKTFKQWIQSKQQYIFANTLDNFFPDVSFSKELDHLYEVPSNLNKEALLQWLRWNEFYGHMQRVLVKVDRMSMANSLEVRVPFLDRASIEYAWKRVPLEFDNQSHLKKELKDCAKNYFPEALVEHPKQGFSVPIEQWLRKELKSDVMEFVLNKPLYGKQYIDVKNVRTYVTDFYDNKHNNGWGVWHIYAWQKWAYNNV